LNSRFIQVMEALGHTGYSLSRKLGTSEAVISNVRSGKNPPNIQLVRGLLKEYEAVNAEWLLVGKGPMFHTISSSSSDPTVIQAATENSEKLDQLIDLFKRSIEIQVRKNLMNDEAILALEDEVAILRKSTDRAKKGLGKVA